MASYIGVAPPEQTGIVERYRYTGDGSTTAFSGADANSKILRYTSSNPVLVFLNGVQLVEGTDFTKTSNTVITFTTAPANSDDIEILTFGSFDLNSPATLREDLSIELSSGEILVGNSSNQSAKVTPSGDATISNTGVITVSSAANADTATALETARTIAGQSFDGSANITIASTDLSNTSNITLNDATQTLTNKTLTNPTINAATFTGDVNFDSGTLFIDESANRVGVGSTTLSQPFTVHNTTSAQIHLRTANPSIRFSSDEAGNSEATRGFIGFATNSSAFINGSAIGDLVLRGKSQGNIILGDSSGRYATFSDGGNLILQGSLTFEGSTADAYETTLTVTDPTADRTITLPDATGTVVLKDTPDTLTNKTIDSANNTITITESDISDLGAYITASSTDTKAYCVKRSYFRISFTSKWFFGSKSFNSQAKEVLNFSVSNLVIGPAPLTPFFMFSQYSSTEFPIGVNAPIPVITTLLIISSSF